MSLVWRAQGRVRHLYGRLKFGSKPHPLWLWDMRPPGDGGPGEEADRGAPPCEEFAV